MIPHVLFCSSPKRPFHTHTLPHGPDGGLDPWTWLRYVRGVWIGPERSHRCLKRAGLVQTGMKGPGSRGRRPSHQRIRSLKSLMQARANLPSDGRITPCLVSCLRVETASPSFFWCSLFTQWSDPTIPHRNAHTFHCLRFAAPQFPSNPPPPLQVRCQMLSSSQGWGWGHTPLGGSATASWNSDRS